MRSVVEVRKSGVRFPVVILLRSNFSLLVGKGGGDACTPLQPEASCCKPEHPFYSLRAFPDAQIGADSVVAKWAFLS